MLLLNEFILDVNELNDAVVTKLPVSIVCVGAQLALTANDADVAFKAYEADVELEA
jgi:hypothetical protein